MKKNLYFSAVYSPGGDINKKAASFIMLIVSPLKLILHPFLRKDMGERFFTLFGSLLVAAGMFYIPHLLNSGYGLSMRGNVIYYLFVSAFVILSVIRYMEIRRKPSVFDFRRFSKSPGIPHDFFFKIQLFVKRPSLRTVEVYYEPIFCFVVGLVTLLFGLGSVGAIIILSSLAYFITNFLGAHLGDHFIMDHIDEMICNEELSETFVKDEDMSPRGVPFYAKKPNTAELRQDFVNKVFHDEDDDVAVVG